MKNEKRQTWQFPWRYKECIAIVLGVVFVGFALQLTIGKFNYYLLLFPVNAIIGVVMSMIILIFSFFRKSNFYQWFSGVPFSVSLIGALLFFGLIMGLTPQFLKLDPHQHDIFTILGFRHVTSSWSFVLVYILTLMSLGSLIVRRLIAFTIWDYGFYLNHVGLWILLFAAGLGSADMKRYVMHVREGEVEWRVYDDEKEVLELPIGIQLNDFDMEEYTPKLTIIDRKSGESQSVGKLQYYQIGERNGDNKLGNWQIEIEEYIHSAIRNSDSTYKEVPMPGSRPAAKIKAIDKTTGRVAQGWVSSGNLAQLYMTLPLDSQYCIVMTQPEPKKFMSDINVYTEDGKEAHAILEVNKPLDIGNWTIYQYGYDNDAGKMSTYSSMELVYDPWVYPVYVGICLLALGSLCLLWSGNRKKKKEYDLE